MEVKGREVEISQCKAGDYLYIYSHNGKPVHVIGEYTGKNAIRMIVLEKVIRLNGISVTMKDKESICFWHIKVISPMEYMRIASLFKHYSRLQKTLKTELRSFAEKNY